MKRIGLISDTHGLLRPQALAFLEGCAHIVHAGDICDGRILRTLADIAPLTAVRGNNDHGAWTEALRDVERVTIDGVTILAIHDLAQLRLGPAHGPVGVVVSGHSHRPHVERREGVLYVNPGSAGPRRFTLPIAIGELTIAAGACTARTVELDHTS